MPGKNIAVPTRSTSASEDRDSGGTPVEALEWDLARRWLERVGREGQLPRGTVTDDEVEAVVERAV